MKASTKGLFGALPILAAILSVSPVAAAPVPLVTTIGTVDPNVYILTDQGTFDGGYVTNGTIRTGTVFTDTFSFEVTSASGLSSAVTNNPYVFGDFTINTTGLSDKILLNGATVASSSSNGVLNANLLANTIYNLVVTGTIDGNAGASYTVGYNVSAVPVPGAVVLFGSGLIALAGFARRSRKAAV